MRIKPGMMIPSFRHWLSRFGGLKCIHVDFDPQSPILFVEARNCRDSMIGRCRLTRLDVDGSWTLDYIEVSDGWKRRGLGTKLLKSAIEHASSLSAVVIRGEIVEEKNHWLVRWYQSFGFQLVPLVQAKSPSAKFGIQLVF